MIIRDRASVIIRDRGDIIEYAKLRRPYSDDWYRPSGVMRTYRCSCCKKYVEWQNGAADSFSTRCDDCWHKGIVKLQSKPESKLTERERAILDSLM